MRLDPPFLAGFIAGEGHFWVRPNNGGQSWACGFQLVQREDNASLVVAARDLVGVGSIHRVPARSTSRPQIQWLVESIADCVELVALLDGLPLLGKKAGDYRIWRTAVARWASREDGQRRWAHLRELAAALKLHRHPFSAVDYTRIATTQWYRGSFLAGFASAEGHFGVSRDGHPRFGIKLRQDDAAVLSFLASRFHVGRLQFVPPTTTALGQVNWLVTHLAELRALIEMLNWNPPLGRTGHIYRRWRPVVLARDRSLARGRLAAELRKTRRELATFQPRVQLPSRVSSRARYLAVLKRWSGAAEGPFTATAYTAWRRAVDPTLPSRNTVARAFGSWVLALGTAGLSTEGCRPTAQVAATRRAAAARRAKEDPALRAKVLLSVARCEAELGGRPRALAYLRWRLDVDPDSPSQATIYRLFPGGWASVLAALDAR